MGDAERVIPENRTYCVRFRGAEKPEAVLVNGQEALWEYDEEKCALHVVVHSGVGGFQVTVRRERGAIAEPDRNQEIFRLLLRAQLSYDRKQEIYNTVRQEENPARLAGKLHEIPMNPTLRSALLERILAAF